MALRRYLRNNRLIFGAKNPMINIGSRNASRKTLWRKDLEGLQVAPRAGAWIETLLYQRCVQVVPGRSRVGAS